MGMDGTMCVYGVGMRKGMLGFSAPYTHNHILRIHWDERWGTVSPEMHVLGGSCPHAGSPVICPSWEAGV